MQQQPQQNEPWTPNVPLLLWRFFQGFAYTFEVLLHRNIGLRYAESHCLFSLAGLAVFLIAWSDYDLRPLLAIGYLFLCFHVVRRLEAITRRRRGDPVHSFYVGDSILMTVLPWLTQWQVQRVLEPLLLVAAAGLLFPWNQPLAVLMAVGSVAIVATNWQSEWRERERVQSMHDAYLENQRAAERFRHSFGNGE